MPKINITTDKIFDSGGIAISVPAGASASLLAVVSAAERDSTADSLSESLAGGDRSEDEGDGDGKGVGVGEEVGAMVIHHVSWDDEP